MEGRLSSRDSLFGPHLVIRLAMQQRSFDPLTHNYIATPQLNTMPVVTVTRLEMFWVRIYPFLLSRGYRLRPRYDPSWVPSWLAPGGHGKAFLSEDNLSITVSQRLTTSGVLCCVTDIARVEMPCSGCYSDSGWY